MFEWNQQVFYFDYEQTVQKILFNPFRKAQNTTKVIETSNKPVFKDKILIVWRRRINSKRTSERIFSKNKTYMRFYHFTQIKNLAGLQTPCKSLTQNQSSALIAYPSLFLIILKRTTVATLSTLICQLGSIQKLYITPHKMTFLAFLYRYSLRTFF